MALVFFTGKTSLAVLPDAGASPHAEATETGRQQVGQLVAQPLLNGDGRSVLLIAWYVYNIYLPVQKDP
jgi:hypothetical protein